MRNALCEITLLMQRQLSCQLSATLNTGLAAVHVETCSRFLALPMLSVFLKLWVSGSNTADHCGTVFQQHAPESEQGWILALGATHNVSSSHINSTNWDLSDYLQSVLMASLGNMGGQITSGDHTPLFYFPVPF